jgi:hypothetical protein
MLGKSKTVLIKMDFFWVVASCSLVEVTNVSEVLNASIIRAMCKPHAWNQFEVQEPVSQGRNLDWISGE